MNLTIIAAVSENNVIGCDGKIPWHISEDLKRFKELTLNNNVIMGRGTYESLGKILPKRKNIVLSNTLIFDDKIYIARNIDDVLDILGDEKSYVIGGEKIYKMFLPYANKIELTRVHENFEGDTFFPNVDWNGWREVYDSGIFSNKEGLKYSFHSYERK